MRSIKCLFFCLIFCIPGIAGADVHLLAMGDWGTNGPGQIAVAATMCKHVQEADHPFDGMLLVGDNFYMKLPGGINDPMWQNAFEKMYDPAVLKMPFYALLGNHDYLDGKDKIELDYANAHPQSRWKLPARWYRIDFPPQDPQVTVLMLDSNKDVLTKAGRWDQEKQWLADELAKPRGTWTLCCAHHPLFSNGGHGDNAVLQQQWGPLFVKYKVDFFICGHDHDLQHLQIPRWFTSFLLVGGGGADTKMMRHDDRGPMSRLTHGFADLSFSPDTVTVKYINEEGKLLHEFSRKKDGTVTVQVAGGDDKAAVNPLRALEGIGGYTPPASQPVK
jgi:hypothetical protein